MTNTERAKKMARMIFTCCMTDDSRDISQTVQRLAFKGGVYPDAETDLGGMSESCLAGEIERALNNTVKRRRLQLNGGGK